MESLESAKGNVASRALPYTLPNPVAHTATATAATATAATRNPIADIVIGVAVLAAADVTAVGGRLVLLVLPAPPPPLPPEEVVGVGGGTTDGTMDTEGVRGTEVGIEDGASLLRTPSPPSPGCVPTEISGAAIRSNNTV